MSCTLPRYTYLKNLVRIWSFIKELEQILCFHIWPPGGQAENQTGPKLGLQGDLA